MGLAEGELPKIHAAQAAGCAPVINALESGAEYPEPVRPDTIAKSIAIGNPADGHQVLETVRGSGGTGARATDAEILDAIALLARTEGIFTEPAGGTTLAATINLLKAGAVPKDESIVVCITGNGYKTAHVIADRPTESTHNRPVAARVRGVHGLADGAAGPFLRACAVTPGNSSPESFSEIVEAEGPPHRLAAARPRSSTR